MNICSKCGESKILDNFYIRKDSGRHMGICKTCHKKRSKLWVKNNPEKRKVIQEKSDLKRHDYIRAWRLVARRKDPKKWAKWNLENPEQKKAINRRWCQNNREWLTVKASVRRALKVMAIPKWANMSAIEYIYKEASRLGLEVDHIVPLKHRFVCGLHVETNLQLLTIHENRRKSNTWPWPKK